MKKNILYTILTVFVLSGCASLGLKKFPVSGETPLEIGMVSGNKNIELHKTQSKIKVYAKKPKKLMEEKLERGEFRVNRETLTVNDQDQSHFRYWVTDKRGDVDLLDLALPPVGKFLIEVVDKNAKTLAVKGFPKETLFYIPRISLPGKKVKPGDSWTYSGRWKGLETGWPFAISVKSTLKAWVKCGTAKCAHIKYSGAVSLPEDSPIKEGKLDSEIRGEVIYAPIGHQFLWTSSSSREKFDTPAKTIIVSSCSTSFQETPNPLNMDAKLKKRMSKDCY